MRKLIRISRAIFSLFVICGIALSQTTYYSTGSVSLGDITHWNSNRDGISGAAPTNFTTAGDVFVIQGIGGGGGTPHAMTLSGKLTFGSSSNNTKLQIENGASLTSDSLTFGSTAIFQIDNGGTYTHNGAGAFTSLFAGTEIFGASSNFIMGGSTSPGTGPSTVTFSGSFGNFTFSTTSSTTMQCNDLFPNVAGNFIKSSASAEFRMAGSVAGNGGFIVGGNFALSGGTFSFGNGSVAPKLTVLGDFTISGGTFQQAVTGGSSGSPKVDSVIFSKDGVQNFVKSGGTITAQNSNNRIIAFVVSGGTTLNMGTNVLDCNSNSRVDFNLNSNGTLRLGDAGGIVVQGTLPITGNIRTTAASVRSFSTSGNYKYNGSTAQVTGSGLPSTVTNLSIDNTAGVTLSQATTVNGVLNLAAGNLDNSTNAVTLGDNAIITGSGTTSVALPNNKILKITANAGTNGSISPSGDVLINNVGDNQSFVITPNTGFHVDSVIVDNTYIPDSTTRYTFSNIAAPHTIRVVFAATDFEITATAGANGSISPAGVVGVSSGGSKKFIFTPNSNYLVDSVIVDGVKVGGSTTQYTFSNVTANHTIRITFIPDKYTIVATSSANGSITPNGNVSVNLSGTQQFVLTPDANYQIDSVVVDGAKVDSSGSYTFANVTDNHSIHVYFGFVKYKITAIASAGATITPSGNVFVEHGADQTFIFSVTNAHYLLDSVVVDGVKVDSTTRYTFFQVTNTHIISVHGGPIVMGIRSNGTGGGNWNTVSTWQGGFVPILSDTVTILGTDSVVATGKPSAKFVNVLADGKLYVADTLTVATTDSLNFIDGTIINNGLISTSGKFQFRNGSKYLHTRNGGSIPVASWRTGSTMELTGITGTAPSNRNQNFHNIVWNNPGQTGGLDFGFTNNTIGGTVRVINSNTQAVRLSSSGAQPTSGKKVITINGDILIDSSVAYLTATGSGSPNDTFSVVVKGNIVSKGTFQLANGGGGMVNWYLEGDVKTLGGTFVTNSEATKPDSLIFKGSTVQNFVNGVPSLSNINLAVANGATLTMDTSAIGASSSTSFTLYSGATFQSRHANGVNGNLTGSGTKSLSEKANYAFAGTVAQGTGTLLPTTVNNLTINNAAGVVLSQATKVNGVLALKAGLFDNTNPVTIGPTGSVSQEGGSIKNPVLGVEEIEMVPFEYKLYNNYPNPFNPTTTIQFTVAKTGIAKLKIYNMLGQEVATLFNQVAEPGQYYKVQLNGASLASGMYFSVLENDMQRLVKKIMLLK